MADPDCPVSGPVAATVPRVGAAGEARAARGPRIDGRARRRRSSATAGTPPASRVRADGADRPTLVLDAGTGLRSLTGLLDGRGVRRLHRAQPPALGPHAGPAVLRGRRPRRRRGSTCYLPAQDGRSGRDLLAQSFVTAGVPDHARRAARAGGVPRPVRGPRTRSRASPCVAVDVEHKGGRTFGLRVDDELGSIAYLPDHAPAAGMSDELMELLDGRRRAAARRAVPRGRAAGRRRLRPRHRAGRREARPGVRGRPAGAVPPLAGPHRRRARRDRPSGHRPCAGSCRSWWPARAMTMRSLSAPAEPPRRRLTIAAAASPSR